MYKVCIILISVCLAVSVSAFDGNRKGFVLGGGLGFAPAIHFEVPDSSMVYSYTKGGVALSALIGYAWDNMNMIVYEENISGRNSEDLDLGFIQGYQGPVWYHYFNEGKKSMFTTLGLGWYGFEFEDNDANKSKFGFMIGSGYVFNKHWQIGAYYSAGKTSRQNVEFNHSNFSILISGIAF